MPEQNELDSLKKQRAVLKSKLTRFSNYINSDANQSNKTEIKIRMSNIEDLLNKFEDIHSQIEEITEASSNDFEEFENLYYSTISQAQDIISNDSSHSNQNMNDAQMINQEGSSINIRLPKIELVTFDGSYSKWLDFYNSFTSMVHSNNQISNIQKLHYLKSCLKGEAMSVINALEASEENYSIAWELLKNRFDNKRVIIQNHVKTLMELPGISKESAHELRKLIDTVQTHLRALKSLGEPVDEWDTLLIYIITRKIDVSTHREWEKTVEGNEMPRMKTFMKYLEQRCQILQVTALNMRQDRGHAASSIKPQNQTNKRQAFTIATKSNSCPICRENHKLYGCESFRKMEITNRIDKVKGLNLCFNCFNTGHRSEQCKWGGCRKCGLKHNSLIHLENKTNKRQENEGNNELESLPSTSSIKAHNALVSTQALLSTAVVNVKGRNGKLFEARVLLDSGSQSNFMRQNLADRLELPVTNVNLPVEGLNQIKTRIKHSIKTEILSRVTSYQEKLEFLILPNICNSLPNQFIDKTSVKIPLNLKLADPKFYEPNEIDALLGVEIFFDLLCVGQIEIPGHKARLQKSKLGWILSGKIGKEQEVSSSNCLLSFDSLNRNITKFWTIEEIEEKTFLSDEEFKVEQHFQQNTTRDPLTGRYIVRLPFNEKIKKLGESYEIAKKQFHSLERKFAKNDSLKIQYVENMREAISLGHMVEIESNDIHKEHCYLPHHPVIKESSSTTKLRIVHNASAKTSTSISLNDCLMVGAVVQSTSLDILLRFRTHQIVLIADIEKMYKQVHIHSSDAQYQLVLWRESENNKLKTFKIPVVLFGSASAPHLATRVLNQLAEDEKSRFPKASQILKRDCYVDDVITGVDTLEEAKTVRDELIGLTKSGGFTLRKWMSNHPEVIETMPDELSSVTLLTDNGVQTKALGIQWNNSNDEITYCIPEDLDPKMTKRSILSNIARLYDPIGLIGPVIVSAKILMQQLWKCSAGWDESLPHDIHTSWLTIRNQLPKLKEVEFDRKVIISDGIRKEIHGFCDASERAYGACIYIRSIDAAGRIKTNLLCSKNRIAPLKTISLPKLELCGALLLSRLIKVVLSAIGKRIDEVILWSDSAITLQWIRTQPYLLKTFVANRVAEIRDITSTMQWRHTPSLSNSADVLSRGQLPEEFVLNENWKTGPEWLQYEESQWPTNIMQAVPLCELKSVTALPTTINLNSLLTKYSTISKLKRVMAYVLRYKNNLMKGRIKRSGHLTSVELNEALVEILKFTQGTCFGSDIRQLSETKRVKPNSKILALNPFLDSNGLIRVGGRLKNSELSYSTKYPIILPKNNHVTDLILIEQHINNLHSGVQATLNAVRSTYWPLNGKNAIKAVIKKCITCFRVKPTDTLYFMGDLPKNRVIQSRPFLNSGVDYCGPFFIKERKHRNRGKVKVYVCIFVCFTTKAVHIEVVSDLSTDAFIGSLRRFFARRGCALNLYSDNATNFVGAKNEIKQLSNLIQSESHNLQVSQFLTNKGINWHFSPPRSPHFAGLAEAAVKSFKHHYYRVIGAKLFTYEELVTYTTEIEAILNSRPITPLSEDPTDLRALTPAHFLIGDTLTSLPEQNIMEKQVNRLSSWQHIQYMKQHFWRRWYKEYLNQLNTRSKWRVPDSNNIKIGTLVLLKEDNTPPLHWHMGRIVETFPGTDGVVRVVSVKTHAGTYKRAVTRVAPLPIEQ